MKKNILMRTNLLVCAVIVLGFISTAVISYRSNQGILRKDMESVTTLASEGIYHQIDSYFSKPINISMTMANDSLLRTFLAGELEHFDDDAFIDTMRAYLNGYREKYGYDSVFLASAQTKRYYHFNGLDRLLKEDDPENVWFYNFLASNEEYSLNIDNDEVRTANNDITVFINCRIKDSNGKILGAVGVGFRVTHLQALFQSYEEQYGVQISLVDESGDIQISTTQTGFERSNLFDTCAYPELKNQILGNQDGMQTFWHNQGETSGYLASRFIPTLGWQLIVDNDATAVNQQLTRQLVREFVVIAVIILVVLAIITGVIRKYNVKIIELTVTHEQEHNTILQKSTQRLYENIYEIDVTHNYAASEATRHYFETLGAPKNTPFDKAIQVIAQKQIKEEFRQGYLDTFSPQHVLEAYRKGTDRLQYDFMISNDGVHYYWMRIIAHLFFWEDDGSVRMLVYRQNIDEEKRREQSLYEKMQKDSLTALYNKAATQENIRAMLSARPDGLFAFFILDIDNFKSVNDRMGHAAGDTALIEFSKSIEAQFHGSDVVLGRIGGDEFVAFLPVPDRDSVENKARELARALARSVDTDAGPCALSSSIGIAIAPDAGTDFETLYRNADTALYQTKQRGKNGYTIFSRQ